MGIEEKFALWLRMHASESSYRRFRDTYLACKSFVIALYRFPTLQAIALALSQCGWITSRRRKMPVDGFGRPIPWYTYSCINFLSARGNRIERVFEFGSGNSTLFWSELAREVVALEHDEDFYKHMSGKIPSNVKYHHIGLVYGGEYSRFLNNMNEKFDLIVIDGRDRVNCAKNCIESLSVHGVIVWDNTERKNYEEGKVFLKENGFRSVEFRGFGPGNAHDWTTTIYYRDGNVLDL